MTQVRLELPDPLPLAWRSACTKCLPSKDGERAEEMNTIDYVYRFDPHNPSTKPPPTDAEAARKSLEDGNRMFARLFSFSPPVRRQKGILTHTTID